MLSMAHGDGEESYSRNSGTQAFINNLSLLPLTDALERVTLPSEGGGPVVVVDLGSSSGPNTIDNITLIIDLLTRRLPHTDAPEMQVFFNDLPSNDFNTLFQLLSNDSRAKRFYVAGVAGSFYERLFPRSSVHVFYSSNCLHFLSKVPDAILDKDSAAYNRGKSWLMHAHSAVATSYQQQASLDLKNFFVARAAELVSGGLLFFLCFGRSTAQPNEPTNDIFYDAQQDMDEAWSGLVAEGVITEQQRDNFNIPMYRRNIDDLKEAIASSGSLFNVLTAKVHALDFPLSKVWGSSDPIVLSRKMAALLKAVFGNIFEIALGKRVTEIIWQRYEKLLESRIRASIIQDIQFTGHLCVVSLIRK